MYNQQYPSNYYQMYNYYNQHSSYNAPLPTQTAATSISLNVPTVQQPQVSTPRQNVKSLWMGNLEPYMTKSFITEAFTIMGEYPTRVKLMHNKKTSINVDYAFVDFYDPVSTMHKLNGKFIPGTNPPVTFNLKFTDKINIFPVWFGELSSDVDDYQLYRTLACRYYSIRSAKVVCDKDGFSKGYAFISFYSVEEQKHCLNNMNGFLGIGSKPIKVSSVVQKSKAHIDVSSNDSQGCKASQDYGPESQNCLFKPKLAIETNGNLNRVDASNKNSDVIKYYDLWQHGLPNLIGSLRSI